MEDVRYGHLNSLTVAINKYLLEWPELKLRLGVGWPFIVRNCFIFPFVSMKLFIIDHKSKNDSEV